MPVAGQATWWINHQGGAKRRLSPAGVLVGRESDCDIVLVDPAASRRQALLYLGPDGPRVVPLGRGQTRMRGASLDAPAALLPGDRIEVPGLELVVDTEDATSAPMATSRWMLQDGSGGLFGVGTEGCSIGGSRGDDLRIDGWPAGALSFQVAQERLIVELAADATINGTEYPQGELVALAAGAQVEIGETKIRVLVGGGASAETTASVAGSEPPKSLLPSTVRLTFLPRGGRLSVRVGRKQYGCYLADRRCDLVACLLQPPSPYGPGDFIPDDVLLARVWPNQTVQRRNLAVLLHRVRKDLLAAGLDGTALITRPEGGRAARFSVQLGANVTVE